MLVAGLYNGNVVVYNLQKETSKPAYISTTVTGKHEELVWQVCPVIRRHHSSPPPTSKVKWAPDNDDGYLNFHSVSGDGRVCNWTLVRVHLYVSVLVIIFL